MHSWFAMLSLSRVSTTLSPCTQNSDPWQWALSSHLRASRAPHANKNGRFSLGTHFTFFIFACGYKYISGRMMWAKCPFTHPSPSFDTSKSACSFHGLKTLQTLKPYYFRSTSLQLKAITFYCLMNLFYFRLIIHLPYPFDPSYIPSLAHFLSCTKIDEQNITIYKYYNPNPRP